MSYINVGARYATQSGGPATKTALRASLSQDPTSVEFYGTSPMGPRLGHNHTGTVRDIPAGHKLIVCGPDPERNRKWWANIEIINGKVYMDDKVIKPVS